MKQKKMKYIVEPLMIGGGKKLEDVENFIGNKLNSVVYKSLLTYIGDKDIISFNQVQVDELYEKVLNYIEIMKKTESKLKKMKKTGVVDGIVIDGKSYVETAKGKPTPEGKHKFYAQYVEKLRKQLEKLIKEYIEDEKLKPKIDDINENKIMLDKILQEKKKLEEEIEKEKSKEPISIIQKSFRKKQGYKKIRELHNKIVEKQKSIKKLDEELENISSSNIESMSRKNKQNEPIEEEELIPDVISNDEYTFINTDAIANGNRFNENVEVSVELYNEFSEGITKLDRTKDLNLKEDLNELGSRVLENVDILDENAYIYTTDFNVISKNSINELDLIKAQIDTMPNSTQIKNDDILITTINEYFDVFKLQTSYEKTKTGAISKPSITKNITIINENITTFMNDFEKSKKELEGLKKDLKLRSRDYERLLSELEPEDKPRKEKTSKEEPKLTESEKESVKKALSKDELIAIIKNRLPDTNVEDLKKLTHEDLIQISSSIGVNLLDLNALKLPANATKEQKELVQNLENIRRERKIQEEFERYKSEITNEKSQSEKERTDNNLKVASKSLIKKQKYAPDRVNTKKQEEKTPKEESKIIKKVAKILHDDTPVIKLNENQIEGMGKKKKLNPYMEFLKQFRKENQGVYDNKEMIKQASYAWNDLKGGGHKIMPLPYIDIEGGSTNQQSKDARRMNYKDEQRLDWHIANNIEPAKQSGIYNFNNDFVDEKKGYIPTMNVENDMANRMKNNIRNLDLGGVKLALLMQQQIRKQTGN